MSNAVLQSLLALSLAASPSDGMSVTPRAKVTPVPRIERVIAELPRRGKIFLG